MPSTANLTLTEVFDLARSALSKAGADETTSHVLASIVQASERDGPRSHGLRMVPHYVDSFRSGYANPVARPTITKLAPSVLHADGDNGYYQVAALQARKSLIEMAQNSGIAAFSCANSHHLAGLRFDTEPLAEEGLIAIAFVNSLSMVVPHGGTRPAFGTNPMSFACPRPGQAPIVWDQASSQVALMDVRLAAAEEHVLVRPGGLDAQGQPSTDPHAILETKSLLPFGDHKGSAIAFMVEILGAALAGGTLSVDNSEREAKGALNIKGGNTLIAIDPERFSNAGFADHVAQICAQIEGNGDARVPGDGRLKMRDRALKHGISVDPQLLSELRGLAED